MNEANRWNKPPFRRGLEWMESEWMAQEGCLLRSKVGSDRNWMRKCASVRRVKYRRPSVFICGWIHGVNLIAWAWGTFKALLEVGWKSSGSAYYWAAASVSGRLMGKDWHRAVIQLILKRTIILGNLWFTFQIPGPMTISLRIPFQTLDPDQSFSPWLE